MKRLLAVPLLLALLLCACAKTASVPSPEPANAQKPVLAPETAEPAKEASEEAPSLSPAAERMACVTVDDIHYTDFDVDSAALCAALQEASACQTQYVSDAMPHYMLTVYLTDTYSSAAENLSLTAGLDEPYVRISYRDPEGGSHDAVFENETLYWLLRDIYRVEPDIDEAALTRYRDVLEKPAQKIVVDSLAHATAAGFPGYTGFEIYHLVKTDTFTDGDDTYDVYNWNAAFLTDEPDKVLYAGGMRLDAEGRVLFQMENTVFAVQNPGSGSEDYRFLHWGIYQGETEQAQTQNARAEILAAFEAPAQK